MQAGVLGHYQQPFRLIRLKSADMQQRRTGGEKHAGCALPRQRNSGGQKRPDRCPMEQQKRHRCGRKNRDCSDGDGRTAPVNGRNRKTHNQKQGNRQRQHRICSLFSANQHHQKDKYSKNQNQRRGTVIVVHGIVRFHTVGRIYTNNDL